MLTSELFLLWIFIKMIMTTALINKIPATTANPMKVALWLGLYILWRGFGFELGDAT
jgi:uncharacterized membrane protein